MDSDKWLEVAKKIINGLSVKPGIHIADKKIAAQLVAQHLSGMEKRGELP